MTRREGPRFTALPPPLLGRKQSDKGGEGAKQKNRRRRGGGVGADGDDERHNNEKVDAGPLTRQAKKQFDHLDEALLKHNHISMKEEIKTNDSMLKNLIYIPAALYFVGFILEPFAVGVYKGLFGN